MKNHHGGDTDGAVLGVAEWSILLSVAGAVIIYTVAVFRLRARGVTWPAARTTSWVAGCLTVGAGLVGPLADRAHHDFVAHMGVHILLRMLAPLLLVLAAPVTAALRVLPVGTARPIARGLAFPPFAVLTNPFVAGLLNVGGLWILYRTDLYPTMHDDALVHGLVHLHVLAAGYLFTFAVLGGPDPAPHRASPPWRAAALVLAIAAHNILAKLIYADPPDGVSQQQAHAGAELMYYAGAPVEIALLVLVCRAWLVPRRRPSLHAVA